MKKNNKVDAVTIITARVSSNHLGGMLRDVLTDASRLALLCLQLCTLLIVLIVVSDLFSLMSLYTTDVCHRSRTIVSPSSWTYMLSRMMMLSLRCVMLAMLLIKACISDILYIIVSVRMMELFCADFAVEQPKIKNGITIPKAKNNATERK